ncbi:MAG: aspartate carbamoyltransferase regulatory subunit [Clostridiales Family XIII bacterium]|jgi:aspartate carbamoyltransferase regulatory subunit|nr:aspartate carbamoyltransferase regulatory subunit [Clostridiales Family XIII bacterium]
MVVIDSISKGIVIDHIKAGYGMKVLEYLGISANYNTIAFIMNASSQKHGRKDVIKIENLTDVDLTALGLVDHNATVNFIEDHVVVKKIKLRLPDKVTNVIRCKNPRCVTSSEGGVPHIFHLVDERSKEYRCEYCDDIVRAVE